jgi:hypothetical protein
MHDEGVEHVQLAYFGSVDPGAYGISYTPLILETAGPVVPTKAEYVVVSSFFAAGLTQRMPTPSGRTGHLRLDFHEHLAKRQPAHVVADTMLVYRRQDVLAAWSDSQ